MQRIISENIWNEIAAYAGKAKRKQAAIAYVTSDQYVKFGKGDVLIVNASPQAISTGATFVPVLQRAVARGARVFNRDNLHAKVMILRNVAVIGSANMSQSSAGSLFEIAIISDQSTVLTALESMITDLMLPAEQLTKAKLRKLAKIKVVKHHHAPHGHKHEPIPTPKQRTWLVGAEELAESAHPNEKIAIEQGEREAEKLRRLARSKITWLRFSGTSRFRKEADKGDNVIWIWTDLQKKTPSLVYRRAAILRRQPEKKCTRFFLETPENADDTALKWKQFQKLLKTLRLPNAGPYSTRLLQPGQADAIDQVWNNMK